MAIGGAEGIDQRHSDPVKAETPLTDTVLQQTVGFVVEDIIIKVTGTGTGGKLKRPTAAAERQPVAHANTAAIGGRIAVMVLIAGTAAEREVIPRATAVDVEEQSTVITAKPVFQRGGNSGSLELNVRAKPVETGITAIDSEREMREKVNFSREIGNQQNPSREIALEIESAILMTLIILITLITLIILIIPIILIRFARIIIVIIIISTGGFAAYATMQQTGIGGG